MNTRKVGNKLEDYVLSELNSVTNNYFTKTPNSGAVFGEPDLTNSNWLVECKSKQTSKNFNILDKEVKKIQKSCTLTGKDWLLVTQNSDNKIIVSLELDIFLELFKNHEIQKRSR